VQRGGADRTSPSPGGSPAPSGRRLLRSQAEPPRSATSAPSDASTVTRMEPQGPCQFLLQPKGACLSRKPRSWSRKQHESGLTPATIQLLNRHTRTGSRRAPPSGTQAKRCDGGPDRTSRAPKEPPTPAWMATVPGALESDARPETCAHALIERCYCCARLVPSRSGAVSARWGPEKVPAPSQIRESASDDVSDRDRGFRFG
jgi:hypothetical protein